MVTKFSEYYPNYLAKTNNFEKHSKDLKRFKEYCRGRQVPYYIDEKNFGTRLDQGNISEKEGVKRAFLLQEFYLWSNWRNKGKNIFHFSEDIITLLKETDVLGIDLALIKLPYPSFFIDLSAAKIPMEENGSVFIEGAFIKDEQGGDGFERAISIDFVSKEYIEAYWGINKDLCWDSERGFHSITLFLDRNDNLNTIEDAINLDKKGFVHSPIGDERDENTKNVLHQIHKQFVDRTINFIINCLLYLTTKDADIEQQYPSDLPTHLKSRLERANTKRKRDVAISDIKNAGFTTIKYVGLKIGRYKFDHGSGKEISPHWRRGHWRNQKFGENLSQSKLLWIMPTIVNKEKGEPAKGHVYNI